MRLNEKLARKILEEVGEDCRFFCSDGRVFSSLESLRDNLKEMSDEVFLYHAAEGRNDFSNWIAECLGDVRLADSLIGLEKEEAIKKIDARIAYIKRYLEKRS